MDAFEKQNFTEKSCFIPRVREPSPFGSKVLCPEVWTSREDTTCYLYKASITLVLKDLLTDIHQEETRDTLNEESVELCWSRCL